jgi:hypothetical protein
MRHWPKMSLATTCQAPVLQNAVTARQTPWFRFDGSSIQSSPMSSPAGLRTCAITSSLRSVRPYSCDAFR